MDADTYRVDIAYELLAEPDPEQFGQAVEKFVRLLPQGSQTLLVESNAARPDGLARVAATVPARGPAQALRDVARALEVMAFELGLLDEVGAMRRTVVEYQRK
jgi:hypothetical protein